MPRVDAVALRRTGIFPVPPLALRLLCSRGMRLALLLFAIRATVPVGARVVRSGTVSAEAGRAAIVLRTDPRSLVQVGSGTPAPAPARMVLPMAGTVVVTVLY